MLRTLKSNCCVMLLALPLLAFPAAGVSQVTAGQGFAILPKFDGGVRIVTFPDSAGMAQIAAKLAALNLKWLILPAGDSIPPELWAAGAQAMAAALPGKIFWAAPAIAGDWPSGWRPDRALDNVRGCFDRGASVLFFSRVAGLELNNADGSFVMVDDSVFAPFFELAEENGIPAVVEAGERRNCWLPEESMDLEGDQIYFTRHPREHAYLRPGVPDYWRQIEARDHLVGLFPGLRIIGCHLGSLEWSVAELAGRLERFPNLAVDLAGRIPHLQKQDQQEVRSFLSAHQERLIYASGFVLDFAEADPDSLLAALEERYRSDFRYLTTAEILPADYLTAGATAAGLALPEAVIGKIYFRNAVHWLQRY